MADQQNELALDETVSQQTADVECCAGRRPAAIVLFTLITLIFLGADLSLKTVSFYFVAGEPVVLEPSRPGNAAIPSHEAVTVLPHVLSLKLTANEGAMFGIGQGNRWVFVVISIVATFVVVRLFWKSPDKAWGLHLALALILAGALGNLYDRVMFAAVRDMFWLFPGWQLPFGWTWPNGDGRLYPWIFNLADVALVVGVGLVVLMSLLAELRQRTSRSTDG